MVLFSSGFHTMKQLILLRFEITLNYFGIVQSNRLIFFFFANSRVGNLKLEHNLPLVGLSHVSIPRNIANLLNKLESFA